MAIWYFQEEMTFRNSKLYQQRFRNSNKNKNEEKKTIIIADLVNDQYDSLFFHFLFHIRGKKMLIT